MRCNFTFSLGEQSQRQEMEEEEEGGESFFSNNNNVVYSHKIAVQFQRVNTSASVKDEEEEEIIHPTTQLLAIFEYRLNSSFFSSWKLSVRPPRLLSPSSRSFHGGVGCVEKTFSPS
jgi:hypothetical protein